MSSLPVREALPNIDQQAPSSKRSRSSRYGAAQAFEEPKVDPKNYNKLNDKIATIEAAIAKFS